MRTPKFEFIFLAASLSLVGCGSATDNGDQNRGGSANGGGSVSEGGSTTGGGAHLAGAGGSVAGGVGGAPQTGGSTSFSGSSGTGGREASQAGAGGSGATAGLGATAGSGGVVGTGGGAVVPKFVGNISTGNSVDTGGMKYSKYWDQITPENAGKWGSVQSNPTSSFNWATLDAIYSYTQTNHILFKQHTFVWGSQQPNGTPTLAQVENWIKSFCERYPNTSLIDVVNEPPPHTTPNYTANLGAGESGTYGWITKAFKLARKHCGSSILILNDYSNIESASQETHFIDIVTQIKAGGAPIDAVGAQSHAVHSLSAADLQTNLNTLATETGLPIYITEYDVGEASDATQLAVFQAQIPIFRNMPEVHGITVWGWINGKTWRANTGLVNGTTPRSAMTWLMGELGRPVPPN